MFCTYFSSSLGQDLMVKNCNLFIYYYYFYFIFYFYFWASWARNGRFSPFFEKDDLRSLEVKKTQGILGLIIELFRPKIGCLLLDNQWEDFLFFSN
jgi:hypothetical protein